MRPEGGDPGAPPAMGGTGDGEQPASTASADPASADALRAGGGPAPAAAVAAAVTATPPPPPAAPATPAALAASPIPADAPRSESEIADRLRAATAPLTPVGGGTRLQPGEGTGDCLSTRGLSGIALYEPAALTLVVAAGTPLADLEAALAAEGQMLGFEPDARPGSTIGGVVATNAAGPRRVLSGACRDAMLGVRFVAGDGSVVKNGGRVMKNVTGYDLVKLMAGSRGTLGVLTEIAFRTAPRPPVTVVLRLAGLDAAAAIPALIAATGAPLDVSAALWTAQAGALFRLEGLPGGVGIRRADLAARLAPFGTVEEAEPALPPAPTGGTGDLWRIVTRPSLAAAILAALPVPPDRIDWGGALILARLPAGAVPALPPGAVATRLTGAAPARMPPPAPAAAALEAGLRARLDPRAILSGAA